VSESDKDFPLKWNPDYGDGCLRRGILLTNKPGMVIGELEDNNHAFRIFLSHDGEKITDARGEAIRFPNNTCAESVSILNELVGVPLHKGPRGLIEGREPRRFCSHQFDMACLAYTHISREETQRRFDAVVYDESDGEMQVTVAINGEEIFNWTLKDKMIQEEGPWQEVNIQKGFAHWAADNLQEDEFEAAVMLSKAIFVSVSRRVDMEHVAGTQLVNDLMPKDVCYVYRAPVMDRSIHLAGTVRDYSECPEQILQFSENL